MARDKPALLRHAAPMPATAPFSISPAASRAGVVKTRLKADQWACVLARIINDLRALGHVSHEQLADALNERGIPTLRDGTWHRTTVQNLLRRYTHVRRTNPDLVARTLVNPPAAMLEFIARNQTEHLERQHALRSIP